MPSALALLGAGGVADAGLTYLLRDQFTTAQAGPLSGTRTCEPGPGSLTFVNTNSLAASLSGGKYLRPRGGTGQAWTANGATSVGGFSRAVGLTAWALTQSSVVDQGEPIGFGATSAVDRGNPALFWATTAALHINMGGSQPIVGASLTTATDYQCAVICRANGALYLMRGGTQFTSWTLLWVGAMGSDPTVYLRTASFNCDFKHDEIAVVQKTGALAQEYGKASVFDFAPDSGDTAVGQADGLTFFTWTPVASETLSIYFRRISDDETYRLDCAQTGGTIKLFRRTGGADTELNSGKTQTWTAGTQYRIGILHAAGEIRTYVDTAAPTTTAKHVVTGESFNLASTGVKVSGFATGANLEVWPRTFSGTDLATLA